MAPRSPAKARPAPTSADGGASPPEGLAARQRRNPARSRGAQGPAGPDARLVLGIDPGLTGAAVLLRADHLRSDGGGHPPTLFLVQDHTIPNPRRGRGYDYRAMARWIRGLQDARVAPMAVVIEAVRGTKGAASSSCSIGTGFGLWLGLVAMTGWRVHVVQPAGWHRALKLGKEDNPKTRAARYALESIPALDPYLGGRFRKAHEGIVDAACLAAYGHWLDRSLLDVPEPSLIQPDEAERLIECIMADEVANSAAFGAGASGKPRSKR